MGRGRAKKPKSHEKRIAYALIKRDSKAGEKMYSLLDEMVGKHHKELEQANARIALAWAKSWKPDVDGIKILGKCRKASDLDRELMAWDFVILLSQPFWEAPEVTADQRAALLDHELEHATLRYDKNDEPMVDERGRNVFRSRKHDIQEFAVIIQRHGIWKKDLEVMARAMRSAKCVKQLSMLDAPAEKPKGAKPAGESEGAREQSATGLPKPPAAH